MPLWQWTTSPVPQVPQQKMLGLYFWLFAPLSLLLLPQSAPRGSSHPMADRPNQLPVMTPTLFSVLVGSKQQPSATAGPRAAPGAERENAVFHRKSLFLKISNYDPTLGLTSKRTGKAEQQQLAVC